MRKWLKITLTVLGTLIGLVVLAGVGGWFWFKGAFLDFEGDYAKDADRKTITIDGYTFVDRNDNGQLDVYEDDRKTIAERTEDVLSQMTQEEKIHLLKGSGLASALGRVEPGTGVPGAVGTIVPTPRLGLPTIYLSDGPAGLRIEPTRPNDTKTYYCTAFPIGTMLAASWDEHLVKEVGAAMGNEALEYGIDVILGPGANIHRNPLCGRNFEYYSEDPVLTGNIGAAMVNGIEANGVGTSVKHFVANNQETNRQANDAIVSERAMREIYLKGFEIIVEKAQPWTLMSSYNKVNGTYVAEDKNLLTGVVRGDWGFEGVVMSDWFGGQDAPAMVKAGNDLLEPGTNKQWKALKKAAAAGALSAEEINVSVRRLLQLILRSRKMQNYQYGNNPDLKAHAEITRRAASEGIVLLKNKATLPIENTKNIALFGVTSYDFIAGGTGSGDVNEAYTVSLKEGLENANFKINEIAYEAFEAHRLNNSDAFVKPEGFRAMFTPYSPPELVLTNETLQQAASSSDVGIITIGRNSGEGGDRIEKDDFQLTDQEREMITNTCQTYHKLGKKVVVVLNVGGVIETASWKDLPDAIVLAWQGGQEGGNAVTDVLAGSVNPSGKLPMTFPVNLSDHASSANFPLHGGKLDPMSFILGTKDKPDEEKIRNEDYTLYEEGIYVGYRHFDKADLAVSYPFGYGLSYTDFAFTLLETSVMNDSIKLEITLQNVGDVAGREVLQVYVAKPESSVDRPVNELKAFTKSGILQPNESAVIKLSVPVADLKYWDEQKSAWVLEPGTYLIKAGASSRSIKLTQSVDI